MQAGTEIGNEKKLADGLLLVKFKWHHKARNSYHRAIKILIHKAGRSPDRSLQLDCVKLESLVIANQNVAVNTFPGLVHTARHTMGVGCSRSG